MKTIKLTEHESIMLETQLNPCREPDYATRITMHRTLAPGQVVGPPQGCTLKIAAKE